MAAVPMPMPGRKGSPKFKGKEEKLLPFLRTFETHAALAQLTDAQKCQAVGRYAARDVQELWEKRAAFALNIWVNYKAEIISLYPSIDEARKYSVESLTRWAQKCHKKKKVKTLKDLGKLRRVFLLQTDWLESRNPSRLSAEEKSRVYHKMLPSKFRDKVETRLETSLPNHNPKDPYTYTELDTAAQHVLSKQHAYGIDDDSESDGSSSSDDDSDDSSSSESDSESDSESEVDSKRKKKKQKKKSKSKSKKESQSTSYVKKEESDPAIRDLVLKMNEQQLARERTMDRAMERLTVAVTNIATSAAQAAPTGLATGANNVPLGMRNPVPSNGCLFCGGNDHYIRACRTLDEYIRTGKCSRSAEGRIVTKSGEMIPFGARGESLQKRLDDHNKKMAAFYAEIVSPEVQSVTLWEAVPKQRATKSSYAVLEEAGSDSEEVTEQIIAAIEAERTHTMKTRSQNKESKPENVASPSESNGQTKKAPAREVQFIPDEDIVLPKNIAVPQNAPHKDAPNKPADEAVGPKFQNKSVAENPALIDETWDMLLKGRLSEITPAHLYAISPTLRTRTIGFMRSQRVEVHHVSDISTRTRGRNLIVGIKSLPLREVEALLNGTSIEKVVLDDGSQIVVMRQDLWKEIGNLPLINEESMTMEAADGSLSETLGLIANLPVEIGGIVFYLQVQVVSEAPFRFLLGRPFFALSQCVRKDLEDGSTLVTLVDPNDSTRRITLPTIPRLTRSQPETLYQGVKPVPVAFKSLQQRGSLAMIAHFAEVCKRTKASKTESDRTEVMKYKTVDRKIKPVAATLPEHFRVVRNRIGDPLETLIPLPTKAPPFKPGVRLTYEQWDEIYKAQKATGFLNDDEIKILGYILKIHEEALAWDESMRGMMREDMFPPYNIPLVEHTPWVERNYPIPAGIREQVISDLKSKIAAGVYEPSNSSYRSRWFVVLKKNGKYRIVHNLEPLNAVTIRDSGVPPVIDEVIEEVAGRVIYTLADAMAGYDQRGLAQTSRDPTTFQTPIGTFRLTSLPMGYTNAVSVYHGDVTFVLEEEIPETVRCFIDDILIKGGKTKYILPNGEPETMATNPNVRRFVFEHLEDVNRVLHRLRHAGITITAKKLYFCVPEVTILGHKCTSEGRVPDDAHIRKILDWPICEGLTQVRGFLGITGILRIFIKDYARIANPLTHLTRKDVPFEWGAKQQDAFEYLKRVVTTAPILRALDYASNLTVILAVDSSRIAAGWILMQVDHTGARHPIRFSSRVWKDHESRYSQAKLELYGLLVALKASRPYIIGARNLHVEIDAKYIKGMLNNPDQQPTSTLNRWIATIRLFDFTLVHVPQDRHRGPDGLSRREASEDERRTENLDDIDEWIDKRLDLLYFDQGRKLPDSRKSVKQVWTVENVVKDKEEEQNESASLPRSEWALTRDRDLDHIKRFLVTLSFPNEFNPVETQRLTKLAFKFFVRHDKLYRRHSDGKHQVVIAPSSRLSILKQTHDQLGHRGFHAVRHTLLQRFWWPSMMEDVKWFLKTCDECQQRQMFKLHLPPSVPQIAGLFKKCHVDTMYMPKHQGFRYIVQAIDSLTGWPEARAIQKDNAALLGRFLFEEIMCRWGTIEEIVSDNGTAIVKALDWLADKYHIHHIRISPYNSQAQGIVERSHLTMRESVIKSCAGKVSNWPNMVAYNLWATQITTRRSTGHSPFYMAHGLEPLMPFDITEATYLAPGLSNAVSTESLIALRARQLEKREDDLRQMHDRVWASRKQSADQFAKQFAATIRNYDFLPGELVLVRNSGEESGLKNKYKPRYLGPYVVISRNKGGTYSLAEMDGTVSQLRFAAKRVIPYHLRSALRIPKANKPIRRANDRSEDDT